MGDWDVVSVGNQNKDPWSVVSIGGSDSKPASTFDRIAIPVKETLKEQVKVPKAFIKGAVRGATLGTVGKEEMEGSVFNDQGDVKSGYEKFAGKAGELTGEVIPLIAAEMVAGVAVPSLVAKFGLDAVRAAIAQGAMTGAIFEGAKGAAQNKPPLDTAKSMSVGAAGFAGLTRAGQKLGSAREYLGEALPESMANYTLQTPQRIRVDRTSKGKESTGELLLQNKELGNTPQEIFAKSNAQLNRLENQIQFKLGEYGSGELTNQPLINVKDVAGALDNLIVNARKLNVDPERASKLEAIKTGFLSNKDGMLNLQQAADLRRLLDDEVGAAYTSESMSTFKEALSSMANTLRSKIGQLDPELGQLFAEQSKLLSIKNSITPQINRGSVPFKDTTVFSYLLNKARTSMGTARNLREGLGEPSKVVAPMANKASRVGLSELLEKYTQ